MRAPGWRWWRWLVGAAVVVGVVLVWGGLTVLAQLVQARAAGVDLLDAPSAEIDELLATWDGLLVTNLSLAGGIVAGLAAAWGWRVPPGYVSSVVGRLRWRWLLTCVAVAVVVGVLPLVGLQLVVSGPSEAWAPEPRWGLLLLVIVATTPLQAAGEEYLFRGWLGQTVGSWFAAPLLGAMASAAVTSTLFALAHGSQNVWLFADRFLFGVIAAVLVWWTGGLEAAIALHAVLNVAGLGSAVLAGQLLEGLTATSVPASDLLVLQVFTLLPALVVAVLAQRRGLERFVPPGPLVPASRRVGTGASGGVQA
ncbi:MAG: CPBP family intramembrane glutamic endopeptidase [Kineosporiaceae bacterium]